ncbi:telomerase reverse transcriptase [Fusarium mundagurra]|uniref:Telomerase reverse transcriptase n=1 Tax=Fusarium mundagurra TaxID=1567541 RepID=A0A8H5Z5N5_9HYPO|nr:telomerase reverse transcriptase [Fusarium mundagurra]
METQRKRKSETTVASEHQKRGKSLGGIPVRRDLLERHYTRVTSLREYVLSQLPHGSRIRRKKVASIGEANDARDIEKTLSRLLDTSLVCFAHEEADNDDTRWEQWLAFSQREDESYVSLSDGIAGSIFSQNEIVDFVVWRLFSREVQLGRRPKHLLCDGFRKSAGPDDQGTTTIPGLFSLFPNSNVEALRENPWPQLLALLGRAGEKIMINLLVDASIYLELEAGFNNYYQLTGVPLAELDLHGGMRSRIFYAKPSLTAQGHVQPGYKHIHVLNRYKNAPMSNDLEIQRQGTIKVMMYIFPRQFGLHNVFTSQVDPTLTSQKFQDYTLREEEIAPCFRTKAGDTGSQTPKIPKRLRGYTEELVKRLQVLHGRCSYIELLKHHCPCAFDKPSRTKKPRTKKSLISFRKFISSQHPMTGSYYKCAPSRKQSEPGLLNTQAPALPYHKSLVELATPSSQVSSFCQAVLSKIIPKDFWGDEAVQKHNKSTIMRNVDSFIRLRRFETMSLHEIIQNITIANISWLHSPILGEHKPSKTDTAKRLEIFNEFIYFVFDSLLIPLVRNTFYVTESNTHRYQVFYFRHEVWRHIAEPAMMELRADMLEEVKLDDALQVLRSRKMGFSQVRLLPKGNKLRPIMNLRRRAMTRGPSSKLGRSINAILGPVHSLLKLEKRINPSKLGSTMFSVSDIYTRLKLFKQSLGPEYGKLYFVKADVKAAFDTIPQEAVVSLMKSVPSQSKYTIMKHAEVKPGEQAAVADGKSSSKAIRRWHATALSEKENPDFIKRLEQNLAHNKKNTVFVGSALRNTQNIGELMHLLRQHVEHNLVKIGKKYYRQKIGIPQGSVLSSFLCNYFYADLEVKHLDFLRSPDCLLLRLIDDFLLITQDQEKAIKFVNAMHMGFPEYGVAVNPTKTMVNFDMLYDGEPVQKSNHEKGFPYCGTTINYKTLDITKDRDRDANIDVSASLTVDFGRTPGQNFQRKVLNAFKIQSHLMFYDTSHNANRTVLNSLRSTFIETASKISRVMRYPQYICDVRKSQVALNACLAFEEVLAAKQTNYQPVVKWLRNEADRLASGQKYELLRVS